MNKKALLGIGMFVIVTLIVVLVQMGGIVRTQKTTEAKVYRIGVLSGLNIFLPIVDGLKQKMAELGYVEGKNIIYDVQQTNFEPEKERQILKQFVADHVDLIMTFPTEVSLLAKEETKGTDIPIVFASAFTEGVPLIESLSAPGGNVTGVRFPGPEISVRRLEMLHEIDPPAKRIWVTYQKDYPTVPHLMANVRASAEVLGVTLVEVPAMTPEEVSADLAAREKLRDIGIDAMLTITEPLAINPNTFAAIITFADKHKLPLVDTIVKEGDTGPILSLFIDHKEAGIKSAILMDKIFRGSKAGTIPVASQDIYLTVNELVARKLGITLDQGLLSQAIKIIR